MKDALGHEISTASPACAAALDAATHAYLSFKADTGRHVKAALDADPGCAMANIVRGYLTMLVSNAAILGAVDKSIVTAEAAAAAATKRERLHLQALKSWRAARNDEAIAAWEALLAEYPHDLLALRLAHFAYFWTTGDARRMRASIDHVLARWAQDLPGYGFVLGMHAFGCEESGDYAIAERQGRAAVAANPDDLWAVHAITHVMEMQGRHEEGARWVEANEGRTEAANNFRFHLAWHRALFLIEAGRLEEMLEIYDSKVRDLAAPLVQSLPDFYIDVQNAASLLARLELLGVDVGARWKELADKAEARIGDHLVLFTVPHWTMALAACGRWAKADALIAGLRDPSKTRGASEADVATRVAAPACEAVRAHRRREYAAAVDALYPVRGEIVRLGGSHAQRDVLWQIMTDAAARAGRAGQAQELVAEVRRARPDGVPAFYRRIERQLAGAA
jgi:tetratricopeptide (TPR) repeat protein